MEQNNDFVNLDKHTSSEGTEDHSDIDNDSDNTYKYSSSDDSSNSSDVSSTQMDDETESVKTQEDTEENSIEEDIISIDLDDEDDDISLDNDEKEEFKKQYRSIIDTILPFIGKDFATEVILERKEDPMKEDPEYKDMMKKIEESRKELDLYHKSKNPYNLSNIDRVLLLDIDPSTKSHIIDQLRSRSSGEEANKFRQWLDALLRIPFGKYKSLPVDASSSEDQISGFLQGIKTKLDEVVCGLDEAKQEILSFVSKRITNPDSKGAILALKGPKGTAKTRLARKGIAEALGLPFASINFGGLKDSSVLTGHDFTYLGSTYGKIAHILMKSGCMNPIIYLDEIDKISSLEKSTEIFGVLTHLLDEEQNHDFEDIYFQGVKLDVSKALFIISFNHMENIDYIAADRMRIIEIDMPDINQKVNIVKEIMLPEIENQNKNSNFKLRWSDDIIRYVIKKTTDESMRILRENIKKILERVNLSYHTKGSYLKEFYNCYIKESENLGSHTCKKFKTSMEQNDKITVIDLTEDIVDLILKTKKQELDHNILHMYT